MWYRKDGELKEFVEAAPQGWEPAGGHYDRQLGVWIDDEPADPKAAEESPKAEEPKPAKRRGRKPRSEKRAAK